MPIQRFCRPTVLLAAIVLAAAVHPVNAVPIEFKFTGTVSSVADGLGGTFSVGEQVSDVYVFVANAKELGLNIPTELLTKVAKGIGPSIFLGDAPLVSGSNAEELGRVKANFLVKKLGLTDSPELDAAIKEAVTAMGASNRNKHRAIVYAFLVMKFKKESVVRIIRTELS